MAFEERPSAVDRWLKWKTGSRLSWAGTGEIAQRVRPGKRSFATHLVRLLNMKRLSWRARCNQNSKKPERDAKRQSHMSQKEQVCDGNMVRGKGNVNEEDGQGITGVSLERGEPVHRTPHRLAFGKVLPPALVTGNLPVLKDGGL
jgi:hypothetical protein